MASRRIPCMALIDEWTRMYESAAHRARALYDGLGDEEASRTPGAGRWSANQCVAHLTRSMETYLACMEAAVEKAEQRGRAGSEPYARGTFIGRFILNAMRGGTAKMKVKAPGVFRPDDGPHENAATLASFIDTTQRMVGLLRRAAGLPLGRLKFGTPVSRFIRVSLAQAFEIHALHNHRHLEQAEQAAGHGSSAG